MKSKNYKNGTFRCRAYLRQVGFGYEAGLTFGTGTPAFVGNFTKASEANAWFAQMKREIGRFSKKYKVGPTFPKSWFKSFLTNHIYNTYYNFCDKQISKHSRSYRSAYNKGTRRYRSVSKNWAPRDKRPLLKAA